MKIKLEDADLPEIEITIKGDISDKSVQHILTMLKSSSITTKIILLDDTKEVLTDVADILYFEVSDRKIYAKTLQGKYLCRHSLSEITSLFKSQGITQIGKSILVNVHHVKYLEAEFSGNYIVTLEGDNKLIVSRFYMKEFRNAITEV